MYAVVATGGKQVKMFEGDILRVEKIDQPIGGRFEMDKVCLLVKDDGIIADPAALASIKVVCEVTGQGRRKKIQVFKKKRKKNYLRHQGHRQAYTELKVRAIVGEGEETPVEAKPPSEPAPSADAATEETA